MSKNHEKENEFLAHQNNCLDKRVAELEIELRELIVHCETIEERGVVVESADETLKRKWRTI